MIAAIVIQIALPLILGAIVNRWLHVGWRYFAYGMLIFFLFQIVTRVPAIQGVQLMIGSGLRASSVLFWAWVVVASLTAGLFEEVGRWVGYRWLMRPPERTWRVGVMYGLGHGGMESMLLVAGLSAANLASLVRLTTADLSLLPDDQRVAAAARLALVAAQPGWFPLLGAWERFCAIMIHVGLSVTVLQVFRRGTIAWLWLAVAAHTLVNLVATGLLTVLGPAQTSSALITEGVLTVMGLLALGVAWQLRDEPDKEPALSTATS